MTWKTAFDVIEVLVALALLLSILLQNRGAGLGGAFGQQSAVFRTRRGLERILYRATIVLGVLFIVTSMISVRAHTAATEAKQLDPQTMPITLPDAFATPQAPGATPAAPPADMTPAAVPTQSDAPSPGATQTP